MWMIKLTYVDRSDNKGEVEKDIFFPHTFKRICIGWDNMHSVIYTYQDNAFLVLELPEEIEKLIRKAQLDDWEMQSVINSHYEGNIGADLVLIRGNDYVNSKGRYR